MAIEIKEYVGSKPKQINETKKVKRVSKSNKSRSTESNDKKQK